MIFNFIYQSNEEIEPIDLTKQISSRTASVNIIQNEKYSPVCNYGCASTFIDQDCYPQTTSATIDSVTTDDPLDENFNSFFSFENVNKKGIC